MGSNRSKLKKYNFVDLFCGAGGFSLGLKDTNRFNSILANDIDMDMCEAYSLNFPKTKILSKSISDIDFLSINKKNTIDVVVGGPPCQAYSLSGKRHIDDPRANLFLEYFRAIEVMRPQIFVYENVKGLFSYKKGNIFHQLQEIFENIGYDLSINLVNALNYGIPQSRERIFIIGYKKGLNYSFPKHSHANKAIRKPLTISDAISDLPIIKNNENSVKYSSKPKTNYQKIMRKNAPDILMDHKSSKHSESLVNIMSYLPEGGMKKDLPYEIRPKSGYPNSYGRLWWNKPATTITRNFGTPSSARCIHPKIDRALTTREGARLQSFPDRYKFFGSRAKKNLQIGNAVPPLLAKKIGRSISSALDKL
tara:strand:- start:3907 stop:5001 length:1095 start_codon:yes stop_codon:yes gene_type:complete